MKWGIIWGCATILIEGIPLGRNAMATWITQTVPITGQDVV